MHPHRAEIAPPRTDASTKRHSGTAQCPAKPEKKERAAQLEVCAARYLTFSSRGGARTPDLTIMSS